MQKPNDGPQVDPHLQTARAELAGRKNRDEVEGDAVDVAVAMKVIE